MNRRKKVPKRPLQERVVEALYELCQIHLDNDDHVKAFKTGALIICIEQGSPLQVLNKRLEAKGITAPLEVYVEQEENTVDVITDAGVTNEPRKNCTDKTDLWNLLESGEGGPDGEHSGSDEVA